MRFKILGSGSTGNATLVQTADASECTLLIDCGFGLKSLLTKLEKCAVRPQDISAVFITHEHGDHVGCAQTLSQTHRIPVWMSAGTARAVDFDNTQGLLNIASDAQLIDIGGLKITPFTVPHDAREPLQLSCTDGHVKLGVLTDLGHASAHVLNHLEGCHALVLESNHDDDLLAGSSYPTFLRQRVAGGYGHLSNSQAAAIAQALHHSGLRHVVAAHLSQQNNQPELVAHSLSKALNWDPNDIVIATANDGCAWLEV